MANACSSTSKLCMVIAGFIYWGAAAGLFFIGGWVLSTYHNYDRFTEEHITVVPAVIIIAIGILMFAIGFAGCVGAIKESKCLMAVFFSLVLVVLIIEVGVGILGYVYRNEVKSVVNDGMHDVLNNYNVTENRDQMDYLQKELKCCGINNASDWMSSPTWPGRFNETVPRSCCVGGPVNENCTAILDDPDIYQQGCYDKLEKKFMSNLVYIASVAITFAVIQILALISSCILICRIKEVRYQTLESGGLRV